MILIFWAQIFQINQIQMKFHQDNYSEIVLFYKPSARK